MPIYALTWQPSKMGNRGLLRRTTKDPSTKPVCIAREGVGDFQAYLYDILIYCYGLCIITFVRMIYIKSVARFGISLFLCVR